MTLPTSFYTGIARSMSCIFDGNFDNLKLQRRFVRNVSRWETGNNLPALDILIEMSDFYEIDLREILDGERKSEKMNQELKETVLKVAEYSNDYIANKLSVVASSY